jgi:hypothetical protein
MSLGFSTRHPTARTVHPPQLQSSLVLLDSFELQPSHGLEPTNDAPRIGCSEGHVGYLHVAARRLCPAMSGRPETQLSLQPLLVWNLWCSESSGDIGTTHLEPT